MGNAGPAILFMLLFAASIIVGIAYLCFLSRCLLVVVQETATGHDEVTWPNEPMQDWLVHAVLFIELLGIWLMPAGLIARMLRNVWLPDQGALRVLLLAGPGLWLFFPIGLLSSLSAQSRWVPFRWAIFLQFLRIAPAALGFYILTAILLGAAVVPWYYALIGGGAVFLPVAAVVSGAVVLIYARLIGRVAWLIQRLPSRPRAAAKPRAEKRPAPKSGRKPPKPGGKKKRKSAAEAQDPWAAPEPERPAAKTKRFPWAEDPPPPAKPKKAYTPPGPEEIEGYGIAAERPAEPEPPPEKPAKPSTYTSPEEYEPIDLRATPPASDTERHQLLNDAGFAEQVKQRLAERERSELPPPAHPLFSGVYTFPLYARCLPNWIALSLGALVLGGILYGLMDVGRTLFRW